MKLIRTDLFVCCDNIQLSDWMTQNPTDLGTAAERGKRLSGLVAARYSILIALLQGDRFPVTHLVDSTGEDRGNLSRYMTELEKEGLVESFDEPSEKLGRPKKFYRLTELGRSLLAPFAEASSRVELAEPDSEEVGLLVKIVNSGSTQEARRAAVKDLIHLARTTRVWKLESFRKFLKEGFAKESLLIDVLDLIRLVCRSAIRDGDKKSARSLLERYGKKLEAIVRDPAQDLDSRGSAMLTYVALEEADEAKHSELMALTQFLIETSSDDDFNHLQPYMLLWLRGFWNSNPREARRWLYELMQKDKPTVVRRTVILRAGCE